MIYLLQDGYIPRHLDRSSCGAVGFTDPRLLRAAGRVSKTWLPRLAMAHRPKGSRSAEANFSVPATPQVLYIYIYTYACQCVYIYIYTYIRMHALPRRYSSGPEKVCCLMTLGSVYVLIVALGLSEMGIQCDSSYQNFLSARRDMCSPNKVQSLVSVDLMEVWLPRPMYHPDPKAGKDGRLQLRGRYSELECRGSLYSPWCPQHVLTWRVLSTCMYVCV